MPCRLRRSDSVGFSTGHRVQRRLRSVIMIDGTTSGECSSISRKSSDPPYIYIYIYIVSVTPEVAADAVTADRRDKRLLMHYSSVRLMMDDHCVI